MTATCMVCRNPLASPKPSRNIGFETCDACIARMAKASDYTPLLEAIDAPVLLMQSNPRQVVSSNRKAMALFEKPLEQIASHRGGQVFDCVHSFTEAGCGKDVHCEGCKIKDAIVDTLTSGVSHTGVATALSIRKADGIVPHVLQVTTEKLGDLALVRIDRYDTASPPSGQPELAHSAAQGGLP